MHDHSNEAFLSDSNARVKKRCSPLRETFPNQLSSLLTLFKSSSTYPTFDEPLTLMSTLVSLE